MTDATDRGGSWFEQSRMWPIQWRVLAEAIIAASCVLTVTFLLELADEDPSGPPVSAASLQEVTGRGDGIDASTSALATSTTVEERWRYPVEKLPEGGIRAAPASFFGTTVLQVGVEPEATVTLLFADVAPNAACMAVFRSVVAQELRSVDQAALVVDTGDMSGVIPRERAQLLTRGGRDVLDSLSDEVANEPACAGAGAGATTTSFAAVTTSSIGADG